MRNATTAIFSFNAKFEDYDSGLFCVECSRDDRLCGHFMIRRAVLGRDMLRLEIACKPAETVQIDRQSVRRPTDRACTLRR